MSRNHNPGGGVGDRLRTDIEHAGFTVRGLARQLAGGPEATRDQVEQWRRYLVRWLSLDGDRGMTPDHAEMLARVLDSDPGRYLSSQYDPDRQLQRQIQRLEEQLAEARTKMSRPRRRRHA